MSNSVVELEPVSQVLPVNKQAVEELKKQRDLMADFVRSQLKEADFSDKAKVAKTYGDGDFGIIPGTQKRCLFKPGAEKLLRLFGLGARFRQTDKEVDRSSNFALYTYRAEVYIVKNGQIVAECEATANSQEIKYKERTEWKKNEKGVRECMKVDTPIFDILNTLQKMAQKRALVGATLLATGASEYFTQDVLEPEDLIDDPTPQNPQQKSNPKDVSSEVSDPSDEPVCCGAPMMISKYDDQSFGHKPWYCLTCKNKKPRLK